MSSSAQGQNRNRKRIAIIGAGCSGLAAIKSCLDEGLEPVCLEKSNDIGGLWNFSETSVVGSASIYKSLVINTSKDMMMFSDFPPPESFPPFLTHAKVLQYFQLYADRFDLRRYISFNTEVKAIERNDDYDVTGKWKVTTASVAELNQTEENDDDASKLNRSTESDDVAKLNQSAESDDAPKLNRSTESDDASKLNRSTESDDMAAELKQSADNDDVSKLNRSTESDDVAAELHQSSKSDDVSDVLVREEVFDGVMVCTGHHSVPYTPNINGLDQFEGQVIHSHSYKEPKLFEGKNVVIIGLGNSAMDIACDLAKTAKQVILASRRGAWIVPKTAFWGLPADMLANSRVVFTLPYAILDWCVQIQANFRLDHATYGLRPQHGVLNCHPCINDELPIHLVNGRVQAKPNVQRIDKDGVWLDDGQFCPCDVIIMATGYDYKMDFLFPAGVKVENNRAHLYKYVFPTHMAHPTLAVIGLIQAIGAVMPIAEMQSRWFTRIMAGKTGLPSDECMLQDIESKRKAMDNLYVKSRRHTLQSFWIAYMDEIASLISAKPNLWRMLLSDPELAIKCYLGPCLPAQFRLDGPHPWPGARTFILNALTRVSRSALARQRSNGKVVGASHNSDATDLTNEANQQQTQINNLCLRNRHQCSGGEIPPHHNGNQDRGQGQRSRHHRRGSPEWMSMTFYVVVLLACCLAWLLSVCISQAEWLINFLDRTVGRYMPLSD